MEKRRVKKRSPHKEEDFSDAGPCRGKRSKAFQDFFGIDDPFVEKEKGEGN